MIANLRIYSWMEKRGPLATPIMPLPFTAILPRSNPLRGPQQMKYRKETDFRSLEFKLNSLEQKFNLLQARLDQIQAGIEKFHLKPPSAQEIQAENVKRRIYSRGGSWLSY
jgi:hypothetical protein